MEGKAWSPALENLLKQAGLEEMQGCSQVLMGCS